MISPQLQLARSKYVKPFYLKFHEVLSDQQSLDRFLRACSKLDRETAHLLLSEREWRGRKTVSWMIGINEWEDFLPQIVRQLVMSESVYAGQGYCVGLALIGNEEAQRGLVEYLETWLPQHDRHYDQHWAMGALIAVDRVRDTNEAAVFLSEGGLWQGWIDAQGGWSTRSPVDVGRMVACLRSGSVDVE